jgi:hypothetical protein
MIRTYRELIRLPTFEERYHYLSLQGSVGRSTFGFDRYLNQKFYTSREWRRLRHDVISRDLGCDLAVPDREIHARAIIHHMNPMTIEAVIDRDQDILNPEYLITVSHRTHNAIHYGDENQLLKTKPIERRNGDTKLW